MVSAKSISEAVNPAISAVSGYLCGKVAVVTGASSGIGQAITAQLMAAGAEVYSAGRKKRGLPHFFPADLGNAVEIERWAGYLTEHLPDIDLVIHSAGVFESRSVADTTPEDLDRALNVNVRLPFRLTQALLPQLRRSRGQIVFINSSAAVAPRRGLGAYAISKQALRAFADVLRAEVNEDGIRVLSVYPGRTATPMQQEIYAAEGKPWKPERLLQPDDVASAVLQALLMPSTAEITDIHLRPMAKN
jgi:NAD(P)-dependent dehydrogenase (short-subunit alcohol dehydrogenase family)